MTKSGYNIQLRDPRWKSKRMEVLERDNHKCTKCGATVNLQVHHLSYVVGRKAWEYGNENFITLCKFCHKVEHNIHPKERFYMVFPFEDTKFYELRSAVDIKVLLKMCEMSEYDTGAVLLPSGLRESLCNFLNISSQQLTNSLHTLKSKKFISGSRGSFKINPLYFWKGTSEARRNILANGGVSMNLTFELSD